MKLQVKMTQMKFVEMTIRCIRNNDESRLDDIITITPSWKDLAYDLRVLEFHVQGTFKDINGLVRPKHLQILRGPQLYNYIKNLIDLLSVDDDHFHFYQFDIPNMPSLLFNHNKLPTVKTLLLSTMDNLTSNWPTFKPSQTFEQPQQPPRPNRHLFFDEENGEVIRED